MALLFQRPTILILLGSTPLSRRDMSPLLCNERAAMLARTTLQWPGMVREAERRRLVIIADETALWLFARSKWMWRGVVAGAL